jgi:hypothetical protein
MMVVPWVGGDVRWWWICGDCDVWRWQCVVVVGGGGGHVVWRGVMCEDVAAGVALAFSFTINPPSTNSRIVCRR